MNTFIQPFLRVVLPCFVLLAGCSSDPPASTARPTCTAIYERCHPLDMGTGDIHECHEFAEAASSTEFQCQSRRSLCFTACTATDAGMTDAATDVPRTDASATDASATDASATGG